MKPRELTIIRNETRFVANKCIDESKLTERYLLRLFHELLLCSKICTRDMNANVATILMDKNLSDVYLKYEN